MIVKTGIALNKDPDAVRYSAPEVLKFSNDLTSMSSDTFSFAMVMLACITEEIPFPGILRDAEVIHSSVSKREVPSRPVGRDPRKRVNPDDLWGVMMRCWSMEPDRRPSMEEVHKILQLHV